MKPVLFFSDEIAIRPHSATRGSDINRAVKLREFTDNSSIPCALYRLKNGDLRAELRPNRCRPHHLTFIEGPEA